MDKLLEAPTDIDTLNATDRHLVATQLLKYMEQSLRMLAQFLPKGPFTYTSPSNTGKASSGPTPGTILFLVSPVTHCPCLFRTVPDGQGTRQQRCHHSVPQPSLDETGLGFDSWSQKLRKW